MNESTDYDGGWKEVLENYFRPFLEFCFPATASEIDWNVPLEFLDKELEEVVRDADLGKQRADILETRFGEVPTAIREQVYQLKDEGDLKNTLRQAARIVRLEEFQAGTEGYRGRED